MKELNSYGNRSLIESPKCIHHILWQQYNNVEKTIQQLRGNIAPIVQKVGSGRRPMVAITLLFNLDAYTANLSVTLLFFGIHVCSRLISSTGFYL